MIDPLARTSRTVIAAFVALTGVAGCERFEALETGVSPAVKSAPYPPLAPLPEVMAEVSADQAAHDAAAADLAAAAARLRAKAAAMRP